jgi:hypothetical protein
MEDTSLLMSDYAPDIRTNDYKYSREVLLQNDSFTDKRDYVVKLLLNESNFNFNLPDKEDGSDFRLLFRGYTLKTWRAHWSKDARKAVLFFKLPLLPAGYDQVLYAYWGNEDAPDISNADDMGFLFTEEFETKPLDPSKWSGNTNDTLTDYGYYVRYRNDKFTTTTNPLTGKYSFRIECGLNPLWTQGDLGTSLYAISFNFLGTENDFYVGVNDNRGVTDAVDGSTDYNTGTYYGLENNSYNDVVIEYKESQDRVIVKLKNRDTYEDAEYWWGRKVEGDTRPDNLSIGGRSYNTSYTAPGPTYIAWLAIRDFEDEDVGLLDPSNLWIDHESVVHQTIDYRDFGADVTAPIYMHESSFGGDPYKISDNGYDSDSNVWLTDDDAIAEDYVAITIHLGWSENIVSRKYIHYDSGHVYHYNASRLSSENSPQGWNHMELTTTSGWAAIKFTDPRVIGAFRIKATTDLDAAPKDFVFYGSHYNPVVDYSKVRELKRGTFEESSEWQFQVLLHNQPYRYYILEIENTYGNHNVKIQEWEMMDSLAQRERKYPTQLRLHPALTGTLTYNFPKQISLLGTTDGVVWDELIPWTSTYTPFIEHFPEYGRWQRYSFNNDKGYWSFKLLCRNHWLAQNGRIAIAEWELNELASEEYTYHILSGNSNNITQIWAREGCTLDDDHGVIFITNDKVNRISGNRLTSVDDLPEKYLDINVVQESY